MTDWTMTAPSMAELSREVCFKLLASASVGRVAVAQPDGPPLVVPVNYVLDGEVVVFRSGAGAKLAAIALGPISFEVDDVDPFRRAGWSVLVQGRAYEATHWEVDHLVVEPWVGGDRQHWVRLSPAVVTGRRVELAEADLDPRGYL